VNQKAAPISKPLLASIIATTLTDAEIDSISARLSDAGIRVSDYIAINYINLAPESPFRNLIKRGYGETGDEKKLDMTVADSLIKIFRDLSGAKLYHEKNKDYAKYWKQDRIERFRFLDDYKKKGFDSRFDYWSSQEGPWREFFCVFWQTVKELMASDDESSGNAWGYPTRSNLFNKTHLTILAADIFKFLWSNKNFIDIETPQHVKGIVTNMWLESIRNHCKEYFARDWRLNGLKKTDSSVRVLWSENWDEFRNDPSGKLIRVERFRPR
jgi:hypothetical protein